MLAKLRRLLLAPILYGMWYLSSTVLAICYWLDEDYTENKLDILEEKWWGREDHLIPHWEKASTK